MILYSYINKVKNIILLLLLLMAGVDLIHAQNLFRNSKFVPGAIEVSAAYTLPVEIYQGDATVGPISARGYSLKAGYRPAATHRRLLVEMYSFYIPKRVDNYDPVPRITSLGLSANLLLLQPDHRINPYIGLGYGLYMVDATDTGNNTTCKISEGCFAEGGPNYKDEHVRNTTLEAGLYLSVTTNLALRLSHSLILPEGYKDPMNDSFQRRSGYFLGVSLRM